MASATTECFIPITSANCVIRWNGLSMYAGGAAFVQIDFPIPIRYHRLSAYIPCPPPSFSSLVRSRCFAGQLDFHGAEHRSIMHLLLPWYAQETRVPFVTARNGAGLLIALFAISFHTTRVCVLFLSRGNTPGRHIRVSRNSHGLAENMRRFALVRKLLLQVIFCISGTLGCNDVRSKSELSL